jgi:hypothetical protein
VQDLRDESMDEHKIRKELQRLFVKSFFSSSFVVTWRGLTVIAQRLTKLLLQIP